MTGLQSPIKRIGQFLQISEPILFYLLIVLVCPSVCLLAILVCLLVVSVYPLVVLVWPFVCLLVVLVVLVVLYVGLFITDPFQTKSFCFVWIMTQLSCRVYTYLYIDRLCLYIQLINQYINGPIHMLKTKFASNTGFIKKHE